MLLELTSPLEDLSSLILLLASTMSSAKTIVLPNRGEGVVEFSCGLPQENDLQIRKQY